MDAHRSTSDRDLLIALNASLEVSHPALCRLAVDLDLWRRLGSERAAAALGVPAAQLWRAEALAEKAGPLADDQHRRAKEAGCRILTRLDLAYPAALHDLALPPPVLYCRGELPTGPAVAVVGARSMDAQGQTLTEHFAGTLAAAGLTIVSGFARGVDATAHQAAVAVGGLTVAVLGCGIDISYPRNHRLLAREVACHGALITEFPMGTQPLPFTFPIRNRVIAALARATLVIQAKARSGSLNTVRHALELGRDVYAVPGSIFDELAQGANALLADGAMVALSPLDLLERLGLPRPTHRQKEKALPPATDLPGTPAAKALLALLGAEGRTAEDLACHLRWPIDRVLGELLDLELQSLISRRPGPVYCRPFALG